MFYRVGAMLLASSCLIFAQQRIPRTPDGKPDFGGVWQVLNTANWDLEAHGMAPGPFPALGAIGGIPPGESVVESGTIPYLPAAAAEKAKNNKRRWIDDPEIKCYMPGVPRATYEPYPFRIVQGKDTILISYEFADSVRTVRMGNPGKAPNDSWMGWNVGRWEGDTLVIDVTSLNDQTWLDRAGDFHSDQLHVVERYKYRNPDIIDYEATIEDAKVYSRPWKISMPLYRHVEPHAQLMEYQCIPLAEDVVYGNLEKKKPANSSIGESK